MGRRGEEEKNNNNVQFQKISILPPTEGIGISWGWGFCETKILKKRMKRIWNFQRGGGC